MVLKSARSQEISVNVKKIEIYRKEVMTKLAQSLPTTEIVGIEVIVADRGVNSAESSFGHAMLRLVDADQNPLNDTVLSFVASNLSDEAQNETNEYISLAERIFGRMKINAKGIVGQYPISTLIMPLKNFVSQYTRDEDRVLQRIIIPTNASQRSNIKKIIIQFLNDEINRIIFLLIKTAYRWLGKYWPMRDCHTSLW